MISVMGYALPAEAAREYSRKPSNEVPTEPLVYAPTYMPEQLDVAAQATLASAESTVTGGAVGGDLGDARSEATTEVGGSEDTRAGTFNAGYFAIFYGPGIQSPSAYQPTPYGAKDLDRPILLKNFASVSYNVTSEIAITPTAYWSYAAGAGQGVGFRDPFLRVSDSSIYKNEYGTNWYTDVRFHFPITQLSRDADLRAGFQNFNVVSQDIQGTRFGLGFYLSERVNFYGNQGNGNDLELYAAPNLSYQFSPTVAALVLYEMQGSHAFGQQAFHFNNDGTDLEPGVVWNITPSLMLNPYLNFTTGGAVSLKSTSIGALVSLSLL